MALTYTAVVGSGRTASEIDAYLYGHTSRAVTFQNEQGVFTILATSLPKDEFDYQADAQVDYLAKYQAGRLQSGSFGVYGPETDVFTLLKNADVVYSAKRIGIDLTKVTEAIDCAIERSAR